MDLPENANPVGTGSDIASAAESIVSGNLLEQPGEGTPPAKAPEAQSEGEQPLETPPETEGEQHQSAEAEAEDGEGLELPDSITGLAEALGLDADGLDALKVKVKVDGDSQEVTLSDALKGYQMEADYRRKTTALAEEKRQFQEAVDAAKAEWQSRWDSLQQYMSQVEEQAFGKMPDEALLDDDPAEYVRAKAAYDRRKQAFEQAQAEARRMQEAQMQEQQVARQQRYTHEMERLQEAIPDLRDPEKGPKLRREMMDYLHEHGFTDREIAQAIDHRYYVIARDAMRFRQLKNATPEAKKKLKSLPKVTKPGVASDASQQQRDKRSALVQQLKKTGSRHDAARVFNELL